MEGITVRDGQAGPCGGSLPCFYPVKALLVEKLIRIVPGLVVLHVLNVCVWEWHVSVVEELPLGELVIRKSFCPFDREVVDRGVSF